MQDTDYIKLVLKHLDSEASPAEQAALQHWLEADQQHRLEYQALEKIWRDSGKALNGRSFDVEAALEKVEDRLMSRTSTRHLDDAEAAQTRILPWKWAIAAASVLLVAGSVGLWYFNHPAVNTVTATTSLQVALPDGSVVHLRKGAVLHYSGRELELEGEAFFTPVHDPAHPFRIHTTHAIFEDIGTSFLVKDKDGSDDLTVLSGKVRFTEKANPSNSLILAAGQHAQLSGSRFLTGTQDPNCMSWSTGILDFKDQSLQEVAADIADYYQTPVVLSPGLTEKARSARVTARFDHQPLKDVLEEIRLMTGLSIRQEKDRFVFSQ